MELRFSTVRYTVRRDARTPGAFQRETVNGGRPAPVGTLAVDAMREWRPKSNVIRRLLARRHGVSGMAVLCRAILDSRGRDTAACRRFATRCGQAVRFVPVGIGSGERIEFVATPEGAVAMSFGFGTFAGRLRPCRRCGEPFVTPPGRARLRVCSPCRVPRRTLRRRIPGALDAAWTRFTARVRLHAHRGTLTRDEADLVRAVAAQDARRLSANDWKRRYVAGTILPLGRGHTAEHKQGAYGAILLRARRLSDARLLPGSRPRT